jgi:transketolase
VGDGECNEGSVWEAFMAAGHYKLDNLVFIIDYNKVEAKDSSARI